MGLERTSFCMAIGSQGPISSVYAGFSAERMPSDCIRLPGIRTPNGHPKPTPPSVADPAHTIAMMTEVPSNLPGHDLVSTGLDDLAAGRETVPALVVTIAAPRLRSLGYDVPEAGIERPSHRLYDVLSRTDHGAHSRYNALIGRIASFARAAEHASRR
jgi:hypothetical protein